MNPLKQTALGLCLGLSLIPTGAAESSRLEINPALLYYQGFLTAPQMAEADMDYLGTNYWTGRALPAKYGELVARYDDEFMLVRLAARSTAPCDWGIDKTAWPRTLLPQMARAKAVAVASRPRVVWQLQEGHQAEAMEDLLGTLALARNLSRTSTIIGDLVQIAMESIIAWDVAENFGQFTPETLQQLLAGLDAAPLRGTLAAAMTNEGKLSREWLLSTVEQLRKAYPGDDARVMAGLRDNFKSMRGTEATDPWDKFIAAANGSSEGMLEMVRQAEPMYQKLADALALPVAEFQTQQPALSAQFQSSTNPLTASFPAILKARRREERSLVTLAMLRAAIEYKLHGTAGFQSLTDPAGTGPFGFRRFVVGGVDRGFQLTSALDAGGFAETLVFVETPGPAFLVGGPHVGQLRGK